MQIITLDAKGLGKPSRNISAFKAHPNCLKDKTRHIENTGSSNTLTTLKGTTQTLRQKKEKCLRAQLNFFHGRSASLRRWQLLYPEGCTPRRRRVTSSKPAVLPHGQLSRACTESQSSSMSITSTLYLEGRWSRWQNTWGNDDGFRVTSLGWLSASRQ